MQKNSLQNRNGVVKTVAEWEKETQPQILVIEKKVVEIQLEEGRALEEVISTTEKTEIEKVRKGKKK